MKYQGNMIIDLLVEFDEMGFCPTTLCEDPEKYAIEWKTRLLKELNKNKFMLMPDGYIKQLYSGEEIEKIVKEREEYKHRAEVAEKAFGNCLENFLKFQYEHNGYQLDKNFLEAVNKKCLQQAEKELQEERKDE